MGWVEFPCALRRLANCDASAMWPNRFFKLAAAWDRGLCCASLCRTAATRPFTRWATRLAAGVLLRFLIIYLNLAMFLCRVVSPSVLFRPGDVCYGSPTANQFFGGGTRKQRATSLCDSDTPTGNVASLLTSAMRWSHVSQGPKHVVDAEVLCVDARGRSGQIMLLLVAKRGRCGKIAKNEICVHDNFSLCH